MVRRLIYESLSSEMAFKIIFSLFLLFLATGAWCADKTITLQTNRCARIRSPNWPEYYDNGSGGRYIITAPENTIITAKCDIIDMFDPSPNAACASERFYINVSSLDSYTAEVLCGTKQFKRTSTSNQLMIGYVSVRYSGKFSCDFTAKPI